MNSSPHVTLRDIARKLGISHVTVSRALRGNPRISAALRAKVQATADAMGYRPNPMASALGGLRSSSIPRSIQSEIAWINFWDEPQEWRRYRELSLYWQGAHEAAETHGYRLEEFILDRQLAPRLETILRARNILGIVIAPHPTKPLPAEWRQLPWDTFSAIRIGYTTPHPPVDVVTSDQLGNGILAFEAILGKGYRRIGFVSQSENTTRFKSGYLTAQLQIPSPDRLPILFLAGSQDRGEPDTKPLLNWLKKEKPDAILTDLPWLSSTLQKAGVTTPRDVALATTSVLDGNITAGIDQNSLEIGRTTVEMLISRISHSQFGFPAVCRETLIRGQWVDGDSLPSRT
jgi:DNA-binding LacI/PurR family transcriptional regulator